MNKLDHKNVGIPMTPGNWSSMPEYHKYLEVTMTCGGMGGSSWKEYIEDQKLPSNQIIKVRGIGGKTFLINTAYEALQEARRQLKKAVSDNEKRMNAMEKLLNEQGGDSAEIARLTEERDQYMKDADEAQAGADIELVCSMITACMGAFSEVANDPRPLHGDHAGTAFSMINHLKDRLSQIQDRLTAGDASLSS